MPRTNQRSAQEHMQELIRLGSIGVSELNEGIRVLLNHVDNHVTISPSFLCRNIDDQFCGGNRDLTSRLDIANSSSKIQSGTVKMENVLGVFGKATLARSEAPNGPPDPPILINHMVDNSVVLSTVGRHPIVFAWEGFGDEENGLLDQIKTAVNDSSARPQLRCVAIVPLRAGRRSTADTNLVTVFILVSPGTMAARSAAQLVRACREILDRHHFQDVAVEVAELEMRLSCSSAEVSDRNSPVWEADYAQNPRVGSSIGIAGQAKGTGTLGFYIRAIANGHSPRYFAATCSHVLSPDGHSPLAPIGPGEGIKIESPSLEDHTAWQKELPRRAKASKGTLEKLRMKQLFAASDNNVIFRAKDEENIKRFEREVAVLDAQFASERNRHLGEVFLTSGLKPNSSGYLLDWGLVTLDPERFPNMTEVTNDWPNPHEDAIMAMRDRVPYKTADIERRLKGDCDEASFLVRKLGRTTGVSKGKLNEVDCYIIKFGNVKIESRVLLAVDTKSWHPFAFDGDSGSLVVDDESGAPVGLLIACVHELGRRHAFGLVIPIEEVVKDMEEAFRNHLTGFKEMELL